jgi:hypothetical protein
MHNGSDDDRRARLNLLNGEPDDPNPLLGQPACPPLIMSGLFGMHRPIDLDAEPRCGAIEVEDVGPDCVLAAEVQTLLIAPEQRPKCLLRLRHRAAETLRPLLSQN